MTDSRLYDEGVVGKQDAGVTCSQAIGFFERVYRLVRQIPPGRVTSYGAIARMLGGMKGGAMSPGSGSSIRPAASPPVAVSTAPTSSGRCWRPRG